MAATVQGVFHLLDRASGPMRRMELQAIATDAAITKLGLSLDGVSSRKTVTGLGNVERGTNRVGGAFRRLDADANRLTRRTEGLGRRLRSVGGELARIGMMATKIGGLGAGLGILVQGIGALSGGVIGLLPRLSDLVNVWPAAIAGAAGLAGAVTTLRIAFGGLGKAVGGDMKALLGLGPQGRQAVRTIRSMRFELRELRRAAGEGIFTGLNSALKNFRGAEPVFRGVLSGMSARIGSLIQQGAASFTKQSNLRDFQSIMGEGGRVVTDMGHGLMNLAAALRDVGVAALPFTRWLSQVILGWTRHAAAAARAARDTGSFAEKLERTKRSLQVLGRFLRMTWEALRLIGQTARPLGNELWGAANRSLAGWLRVHDTVAGRQGLTVGFLRMGDAVKQIMGLVGDLGAAIFRMGQDPGLSRMVKSLRTFVPILERLLTTMADTFGPPMAQMLTTLADIFRQMGTGPVQIVFNAINGVLTLLDKVMHVLGPFNRLIGTAFSTIVIARFLVKLGLLEAGWWRAAGAAAAYGRASGAAMVGGGGGLFGFGRGRGASGRVAGRSVGGMVMTGASRPGLAGRFGLGAIGAASRFALPLLAIQGAFGALTAPREGSALRQAGQMGFGGLNALTFGGLGAIAPGLAHHFMTPEQQDSQFVQKSTQRLQSDMASAGRGRVGVAKLTAEIQVLNRLATDVREHQTDVSRQYLTSIEQEIAARQALVGQLNAQRSHRAGQNVERLMHVLNTQIGRGTSPGQVQQTASSVLSAGSRLPFGARRRLEQNVVGGIAGLAAQNPAMRPVLAAARAAVIRQEARHGVHAALAPGGQMLVGTQEEYRTIDRKMRNYDEFLREGGPGLTPTEQLAVLHLQARGMPRALARSVVEQSSPTRAPGESVSAFVNRYGLHTDGTVGSGFLLGGILDSRSAAYPFRKFPTSGRKGTGVVGDFGRGSNTGIGGGTGATGRNAGGRMPGSGLADSVPAMLAPGELVVNRHQEAAADAALGGRGRLDSIVHGVHRSHRENFQYGGRTKVLSQAGFNRATLLGRFIQGLSPYYTVGENPSFGGVHPVHARNSYHYIGQALDINADNAPGGEMGALDKLYKTLLAQRMNWDLTELIWRSSGHWNHLHAAVGPMIGGRGTWFPKPSGLPIGAGGFPTSVAGSGIGASAGAVATGTGIGAQVGQLGAMAGLGLRGPAMGRQVAQREQGARLLGLGGDFGAAGTQVGGGGARTMAGRVGGGGGARTAVVAGEGGEFARRLAGLTGLSPAVAAAWVRAEGNGGGPHNWLNVSIGPGGKTYSGVPGFPGPGGRFAGFPNLNAALGETAFWINSMSNYAGIRRAIESGDPSSQIAAIMGSSWDENHYRNGSLHLNRGGRAPKWGGWHARGLDRTFHTPTIIGVGEGGSERVQVSGTGGGGGKVEIHATFHINGGAPEETREAVLDALRTFADEIERYPHEGSSDIG